MFLVRFTTKDFPHRNNSKVGSINLLGAGVGSGVAKE